MRTGIVVGAAPLGKEVALLKNLINANENIYTVAADGGIRFFLDADICPDHFIGDMDSNNIVDEVRTVFPEIAINSCSPIKDVTDMEIGIMDAVRTKCNTIYVFGGLGGRRFSHSIANIQLISRMKEQGINVIMHGDGVKMQVLASGESIAYGQADEGFVSVFALSDVAKNVVIKGLFYEYEGDLSNTTALGVSNELVGNDALITVDDGLLLIIKEDK